MTDPDDPDLGGPGRPHEHDRPDDDGTRDGLDSAELAVALAHAESPGAAPGHGGTAPGSGEEARVRTALDRTRADLARHGDDLVDAAPAMPPAVLAGLDRALAAERSAPAPGARRPGRDGRAAGRPLVALAAAAVLLVVAAAVAGLTGGAGAPDAPAPRAGGDPTRVDPAPGPGEPPVLTGADVTGGTVALRAGLTGPDRAGTGPLADPGRRTACLAAHGVPPGVAPAGVREVVFEGRPAVLFVLTTGVAARFRILVVDAGCAAGRPLTLADRVVGR